MTIVGFNASIAKAHGYDIRTNSAGLQYSVKTGTAVSAVATPDSNPIVFGNCGDAYIYYDYYGYRSQSPHYEATYNTGYDVIDDAYNGT